MAGRTLDAIVQQELGIKEMVIIRLQWAIEERDAQLAEVADIPGVRERLEAYKQKAQTT